MIFLDPYDTLQLPMGVTKSPPPPKILLQIKLEEPQWLGFARKKQNEFKINLEKVKNTQNLTKIIY